MAGKKQTAVEWLNAELTEYLHIQLIWSNDKNPRNISVDPVRLTGMFEKAKQMEREQIIEAHSDWSRVIERLTSRNAEQYYNETFKSE
jgi:hypothetical protein